MRTLDPCVADDATRRTDEGWMAEKSPHVEFGLGHVTRREPTTLRPHGNQGRDEGGHNSESDDDRDSARSPPPHVENASPCSESERVAFDES